MARGAAAQNSTGRGREVAGIVLLGLALFLGLSVMSLQAGSGTLMGPCGATVGLAIYALAGIGAYLIAFGLGVAAVRCLQGKPVRLKSIGFAAALGGGISAALLLHLGLGHHRLHGYAPGGLIGEYGAELLSSLVGRVGAALFGAVGLSVAMVLTTPLSMRAVGEQLLAAGRAIGRGVVRGVAVIFPERGEAEEDDEDEEEVERPRKQLAKKGRKADETIDEKVVSIVETDIENKAADATKADDKKIEAEPKKRGRKRDDEAQLVKLKELAAPILAASVEEGAPAAVIEGERTELSDGIPVEKKDEDGDPEEGEAAMPKIVAPPKPKIVAPVAAKKEPAAPKPDFIPAAGGYHLPELNLLDYQAPAESAVNQNAEEMYALAQKLQQTLSDYGVQGEVKEIHPGPVVTMYEFVPKAGTKLSKISSLSNDLAMALAALKVRIVAPIPGKSSVGIEVPNKKRATVYLKEILADETFMKASSRLTLGLGKDIAGGPVSVDLAKMPHLLVAGATGAGKSVGLNTMICSILFNATPEEVRMIMIDPKMVELSIYEGIPHLLLPVVTDPKKANLALKWAVDEMERRYEVVAKTGLRDILSFNKWVDKQLAGGPPKMESKKIKIYVTDELGDKREVECSANEEAVREAGGVVTEEVRDEISAANAAKQKKAEELAAQPPLKKMPYIVVIIDEYADLMAVASKEVEMSVARIAQKARAVGIHLILATQRPSVNVVTGLIKANFPSRIAFQVAQKIDSRTILDQQGAENLLGMGDMLLTDKGKALQRVHGALVTDTEIKQLVDFLKRQGQPVYDMDILKPRDEEGEGGDGLPDDLGDDPEYDKAVRLVTESNNASVSFIQRKLQIGFNRASRLVERMEKDGIVGPPNGSKPREVLANAI